MGSLPSRASHLVVYQCAKCSAMYDTVWYFGCECNIRGGHGWCRTCMVEEMKKDPEWFFKDNTQCPSIS